GLAKPKSGHDKLQEFTKNKGFEKLEGRENRITILAIRFARTLWVLLFLGPGSSGGGGSLYPVVLRLGDDL
nr:hypothetical protein [Tanacetum cinerariifolium]